MDITLSEVHGGLPGKSYCIDELTGLLLMKSPTIEDILACRGIYITFTAGSTNRGQRMFLMGKSFDAYLSAIETLGGTVDLSSPTRLVTSILNQRIGMEFYATLLRGKNNSRYIGGCRTAGLYGATNNWALTGVYAVPHRLVAGHYIPYSNTMLSEARRAKSDGSILRTTKLSLIHI